MSCEFTDGQVVPGTAYRVVRRMGQGGMGSVYDVEHRELGKRFVLKALLSGLMNRSDLVQRLKNEWRALGRLEHPAIVSVTDAGLTTSGVPYFVMERLNGETLGERLRRLGRLAPHEALVVAADVLDALDAAHAIGVVHRDVKPPNIFITDSGATKLLDFGIAKLVHGRSSRLTGRGIAIGTPRYMAPEQAVGDPVDGRCDIYAVGLVLFEAIAGQGAFHGIPSNEVFVTHVTKTAPPLSSVLSGVSEQLDAAVAWLLMTRPSERPATAGKAARLLRALAHRGMGHETQAASYHDTSKAQPLTTELTPSIAKRPTFSEAQSDAGLTQVHQRHAWDADDDEPTHSEREAKAGVAGRQRPAQPATYKLKSGPGTWVPSSDIVLGNGAAPRRLIPSEISGASRGAPSVGVSHATPGAPESAVGEQRRDDRASGAPAPVEVPPKHRILLIAAAAALAGLVLVAVSVVVLGVGNSPSSAVVGRQEPGPSVQTRAALPAAGRAHPHRLSTPVPAFASGRAQPTTRSTAASLADPVSPARNDAVDFGADRSP